MCYFFISSILFSCFIQFYLCIFFVSIFQFLAIPFILLFDFFFPFSPKHLYVLHFPTFLVFSFRLSSFPVSSSLPAPNYVRPAAHFSFLVIVSLPCTFLSPFLYSFVFTYFLITCTFFSNFLLVYLFLFSFFLYLHLYFVSLLTVYLHA